VAEKSNFLACIASKTIHVVKGLKKEMYLKRFYLLTIAMLLFVSACSTKNTPVTTNAGPTVESLSAGQSTPTTALVILTNTSEPLPSLTLAPTSTYTPEPSPTVAPVMTSTPEATIPICTNRATLVRHLSFSDNSSVTNNSYFNKAWRIQNSGTCTWTTSYAFVFASGDQLSAPAETHLQHDVLPGETIDIQISMKSPDVANAYSGNWMLCDPNGVLFGTGETADQPIAINILVKKFVEKNKFPAPECG
jgi:hypothetical protein